MAYREQEKQQDKNRNAQRKLKVEIVEHSRSEEPTSDRYQPMRAYDKWERKGWN